MFKKCLKNIHLSLGHNLPCEHENLCTAPKSKREQDVLYIQSRQNCCRRSRVHDTHDPFLQSTLQKCPRSFYTKQTHHIKRSPFSRAKLYRGKILWQIITSTITLSLIFVTKRSTQNFETSVHSCVCLFLHQPTHLSRLHFSSISRVPWVTEACCLD